MILNMQLLYGLISAAMLVSTFVTLSFFRHHRSGHNRFLFAVIVFILSSIPFYEGMSLASYAYGIFGSTSVTTLWLLFFLIGKRLPGTAFPFFSIPLFLFLLLFYASLFGFNFGPWMINIYDYGYDPDYLWWFLPASVFMLLVRKDCWWTFIFASGIFAYGIGIFDNFFDAIFDPFLLIISFCAFLYRTYMLFHPRTSEAIARVVNSSEKR